MTKLQMKTKISKSCSIVFFSNIFTEISHVVYIQPLFRPTVSIHPSIFLSVRPSIHLFVDQFIYPSINSFNLQSIHSSIRLSLYQSLHLLIYTDTSINHQYFDPSIHPFGVYSFIYPSILQSTQPSIELSFPRIVSAFHVRRYISCFSNVPYTMGSW